MPEFDVESGHEPGPHLRSSEPAAGDDAARFFLPAAYQARNTPAYFEDAPTGGRVHQPDVYAIAAFLARRYGVSHVIDIGCGRAGKLVELHPDLNLVGIDVGANIEYCQKHFPFATWIETDIERGLPELGRSLLTDSVIVCSDVIEHLRDPSTLLHSLERALDHARLAVLSTPERALVRGAGDLGPPANPAHVREWTLAEFRRLLSWAGLPTGFTGLTFNNNELLQKHTILALVDKRNSDPPCPAPTRFRVAAIVATYNEVDIVAHAIEDLLEQGVSVYVLDNWSTDGTYECVRDRFGSRLLGLERFPAEEPSSTYDWKAILERKEQIAAKLDADWLMHADPDEIRRSPWPGVSLRDAIFHVDRQGFSVIDHTVIEFRPFEDSFLPGSDHRAHFSHFEFCRRPGCFLQQRTWKAVDGWGGLSNQGGHRVLVPGGRVFPFKFLLKHYPIRGQEHGAQKIFIDRLPRLPSDFAPPGWHTHIRDWRPGQRMLWEKGDLIEFDSARFSEIYLGERLTGVGIVRG